MSDCSTDSDVSVSFPPVHHIHVQTLQIISSWRPSLFPLKTFRLISEFASWLLIQSYTTTFHLGLRLTFAAIIVVSLYSSELERESGVTAVFNKFVLKEKWFCKSDGNAENLVKFNLSILQLFVSLSVKSKGEAVAQRRRVAGIRSGVFFFCCVEFDPDSSGSGGLFDDDMAGR